MQFFDHICILNLILLSLLLFIYLFYFILFICFLGEGVFQIYGFKKVWQMFPVSTADEWKVIIIRELRRHMHLHAVYVFYLNMLCALTQESGPSTFLSNFLSVTDVYAGYSKQPEESFHFSCHQ